MGLRINTNIAALNAHRNMVRNDQGLSSSLEKLASGLRINKAADDAAGMSIADSLRAQALGLGQAMQNASDGVAMVQVADGALEEYINIINTVRTKAIQAASDGQSTDSRLAIQRDVSKLIEEADIIAKTTAFNGLALLDGNFVDKLLHVGAYKDETVSVSIDSARTAVVGKFALATGTEVSTAGLAAGTSGLLINGVSAGVSAAGTDNALGQTVGSAWSKAAAINSVQSSTGVTADAETTVTGSADIVGGTWSAGDVFVNGINLGEVVFSAQDNTGTLVAAFNKITDQTGVSAKIVSGGRLELSSDAGYNIDITTTAAATTVAIAADTAMAGITNVSVNGATSGALTAVESGVITLESDNAVAVTGAQETDAGFTADQQITLQNSLQSVDVTTQAAAELSISKADHALAQLGRVRSGLGSAQNQIESTIRNISVTRVNVLSAESSIRDVDFAAESATFSKFQILSQAGSFAMAQANASSQNVLSLLQ